jgi:hypothetical protein
MAEKMVSILLTETEAQCVLRAVIDRDGDEALDLLTKVVKPQVDKAMAPKHCRPTF